MKHFIFLLGIFFSALVSAQMNVAIGNQDFSGWAGIVKVKKEVATINSGSSIYYNYGEGKNWSKGYRDYFAGADWSIYEGLSFEIYQKKESATFVDISFYVAEENKRILQSESSARIQLNGKGWISVFVPWNIFNLASGQRGTLQGVQKLEIAVESDKNKSLKIKNIQLKTGNPISLFSQIRGLAADAGGKVYYEVEIGNATNKPQNVQLLFSKHGWEAMKTVIKPNAVQLAPGEVKTCKVEVEVPKSLPQGVREKQILKAIANGDGNSIKTLEFITSVKVPSPFMVHTLENWEKVKDKIEKYDWAKTQLAKVEAEAKKWEVPNHATKNASVDVFRGPYLFHHSEADKIMNCAKAYRLTGKKEYAAKCVAFLRKLSDEKKGYPATLRVNENNFVKEGGVFQNVARAYDMVMDCGLFTKEDHKKIEKTLRLYIETVMLGNDNGGINNWDLSELAGAFYSALVIQDWDLVDWCLNSPSGIYRQFTQGVMSDGWWYECAVGYNLWCSRMFSEIGIAMLPWGENFIDAQHPIGTTPYYSLLPERRQPGLYGMDFNKWGAMHKPSVGIKNMWDALVPFLDYRGVMFAVNDAQESVVTGEPYEMAYFLYRDPEYAAIINKGSERSLLYGVPDLPKVESEKSKKSAYADNMGVVQLRSQTKNRAQREQIQSVLHYGTHGGYHGHFDRTSLISMMRYGRSFFNPEMYWYGYKSYLYKFLVQNSINKNMVTVDLKMQEPKESFRTLFYTGEMMQAAAVETKARWSNPPYGGMIYGDKTDYTFAEKAWEEGRSLPIPDDAPAYSEITDFSEPVKQRRLMITMDDYVVLADYLKAEEEHQFDWLFQMKGFKNITGDVKLNKHEKQMTYNPLSCAQFTTDCNWYKTNGTSRTQFEMCFGEGCDNAGARMPNSEDGPLKMDIFTAWPKNTDVMIGTTPESFPVNKQLWYSVKADDKTLLNDSTGAWVLGSQPINLNINGKKELTLITKLGSKPKTNTIFWGDAKLILKDGSEVLLSSLSLKKENVLPAEKGLDYYGGPIKIGGELMANSTGAMPDNYRSEAKITIDLSAFDAVAFKATIGGDFPLGDESARRKTMAVKTFGKTARYLSVIEPFESESAIKSVNAVSADQLIVELVDGRTQEITISGLDSDGSNIKVSSKEFLNGTLVREEKTK